MNNINELWSKDIQVKTLEFLNSIVIINGEIELRCDIATCNIPESWVENLPIKSIPDPLLIEVCDNQGEPLDDRIIVSDSGDDEYAVIILPPSEGEWENWYTSNSLLAYGYSFMNDLRKLLIEKQQKFNPDIIHYETDNDSSSYVGPYEYKIFVKAATVKDALKQGREFKSKIERILFEILDGAKNFIESELK